MSFRFTLIPALCLTIAACGPERPAEPTKLPEGTDLKLFTHQGESYLRGVKGSHNTSPRGRKSAVLSVRYDMACKADGTPSARARFASAKALLDEKFVVAPLYFNNPRERSGWRSTASRLILQTGCEIRGVQYDKKTENQRQVLKWAIENRVPPARS